MEDPDTPFGTFVHWVLAGIPPDTRGLPENAGRGYRGPCPPAEHGVHRYIFTLYALSDTTGLADGASAPALRAAMAGKIIKAGRLVGTYSQSLSV